MAMTTQITNLNTARTLLSNTDDYRLRRRAYIPLPIRKSVPLSNRNTSHEELPEKRNLKRFRYKNTDRDPMKIGEKQGA
jgi:hypothetical protein